MGPVQLFFSIRNPTIQPFYHFGVSVTPLEVSPGEARIPQAQVTHATAKIHWNLRLEQSRDGEI